MNAMRADGGAATRMALFLAVAAGQTTDPEMRGGFCKDGICFPTVCVADRASIADTAKHDTLRFQPKGYDFLDLCDTGALNRYVVHANTSHADCGGDGVCPPPPPSLPVPVPKVGCGEASSEQPTDMAFLALWIIVVIYMFYGLAHTCEDFLVPALNLLCERKGIPEDVAGATLMAAGCNAPELFASLIGVFIQHSTVGAGTVVGSAPFNILCICGAASFAVGGKLYVDGWLMLREIVSLCAVLGLFLLVLWDNVMLWWQALVLVAAYIVYVLVCCYYERILRCCLRRAAPSAPKEGLMPPAAEGDLLPGGAGLRATGGSTIAASLSRSLLSGGKAPTVDVDITSSTATHAATPAAPAPSGGGNAAPLLLNAAAAQDDPSIDAVQTPQSFADLVADCRARRAARGGAPLGGAASLPEGAAAPPSAGVRCEGTLYKKSRFYSRVRMGKHIWQQRHFVLDEDPASPLRYHRLLAAEGGLVPDRTKHVPVELRKVEHVLRISDVEIHLVTPGLTYKLRCGADAPEDALQTWFDELIVRLDELKQGPPELGVSSLVDSAAAAAEAEEADETLEHHIWYQPPRCNEQATAAWLMFCLTLPLKAAIHLTVPDVMNKRWTDWYMATIALAVAWLAILAYAMNLMLSKIGCALGVSETVMGLTIGAIGTSFPNLYASILTARAGQAGMSLCQAFGSNTFNICICLGLIWLGQTAFGTCFLGHGGQTLTPSVAGGPCHGCYMPMGLVPNCPYLERSGPKQAAGSLAGAVLVVFASIALFVATLVLYRGMIPRGPSALFFLFYLAYVVYEVLATYEVIPPLCFGTICI